jgi:hypothetical protein
MLDHHILKRADRATWESWDRPRDPLSGLGRMGYQIPAPIQGLMIVKVHLNEWGFWYICVLHHTSDPFPLEVLRVKSITKYTKCVTHFLARDRWPPEFHGVTRHSAKFATLYKHYHINITQQECRHHQE